MQILKNNRTINKDRNSDTINIANKRINKKELEQKLGEMYSKIDLLIHGILNTAERLGISTRNKQADDILIEILSSEKLYSDDKRVTLDKHAQIIELFSKAQQLEFLIENMKERE